MNLIIHNSLFPSPYPYPTQVVLNYYPSTTQVLPKYMQAFWTWLHLGYTLGRPWVHLGYTLGRPWLRLGEDLGKTWRFLSQRIHLRQLVGIHVGDADVAGLTLENSFIHAFKNLLGWWSAVRWWGRRSPCIPGRCATHAGLSSQVLRIPYYLCFLNISFIASGSSGFIVGSFRSFTMWSVPCLYFWKWSVFRCC